MRESIKKKCFIMVAGLGLLWFLGNRLFFFTPTFLDYTVSYMIYPVIAMQRMVVKPLVTFFAHKKAYNELHYTLYKIQKERDALLAANIMLRSTQQFIDTNQEVIDFKKRYKTNDALLTQVLIKHISPQEQSWLVDAGSQQGIEKDMVAVWKNCLIGRVTEVYPWYSKVTLITDKRCKVSAYGVQHKAVGIHEGNNEAGQTVLQHVSHLSSIDVGELIISSGQGLVFPKGFALGKVSSFIPGQLFHEVVVSPLIDIQDLEYCYLIRKGT